MVSRAVRHGVLGGLVGTALLNAATYADIALRGRPPSTVPERDVDVLLSRAGIRLDPDDEKSRNRRGGIAALSGYVTGVSAGVAAALASPALCPLPAPLAAAAVGLATMAATDASSRALGTTDPASWSAADWASDVVPHLAFGYGVVRTLQGLEGCG